MSRRWYTLLTPYTRREWPRKSPRRTDRSHCTGRCHRTAYHRRQVGPSMSPSPSHTRLRHGTDPRPCRQLDQRPSRRQSGRHRFVCTGRRHHTRCHQATSGPSMSPSPNHTRPRHGTDPRPCIPSARQPDKRRWCKYPRWCTGRHPRMEYRLPGQGPSTSLSQDRTCLRRGTDPMPYRQQDQRPCKRLPDRYPPACTDRHRRSRYHRATPGPSRFPSQSRTRLHRGTGLMLRRRQGQRRSRRLPDTCRFACRRLRHRSWCRRATPGPSTSPSRDRKRLRRDTDPRPCRQRGQRPCKRLPGRCLPVCTDRHHHTRCHPRARDQNRAPSRDHRFLRHGIDRMLRIRQGRRLCRRPPDMCLPEYRHPHHHTPHHLRLALSRTRQPPSMCSRCKDRRRRTRHPRCTREVSCCWRCYSPRCYWRRCCSLRCCLLRCYWPRCYSRQYCWPRCCLLSSCSSTGWSPSCWSRLGHTRSRRAL
jgi:hypothetical protein